MSGPQFELRDRQGRVLAVGQICRGFAHKDLHEARCRGLLDICMVDQAPEATKLGADQESGDKRKAG